MSPRDAAGIELTGVGLAFGSRRVLSSLDLVVGVGERLAVIGPSGAGKTSLLRMIAAFLRPSAGSVRVLGRDTRELAGRALREWRREVGLLYQNENLIPGLRVVHNVLAGRLGQWGTARALLSLAWPREIEVARAALGKVELAERLWDLPGTLSGGEQQRVAIARLLVQAPRVMLADEPAAALDQRLGREVVQRLHAAAGERDATLVVTLHTLDLLGEAFDRVVALRAGELFWQGRPAELSRELLRELYGAEYESLHLEALPIPG